MDKKEDNNLFDKQAFLESEKEKAMEKVASVSMPNMQPRYNSPYVTLSDMRIPTQMKELFNMCKYFYMFDPIIAGGINALATFPVTEVIVEESNEARLQMANEEDKKPDNKKTQLYNQEPTQESDQLKSYKRVIFNNLQIHKLLVGVGIDYWLYGNCFIFGEFYTNPLTGEREWKHMTRIDPNRVIIDVNDATQEITYKLKVSDKVKRIVKRKSPKSEYDKIPEEMKKAVANHEALVLNPNNIFHFARPTDSAGNSIWGIPVIANVMKLLLYRNVLRQAQEAIAREHIVPFRIFYFENTQAYNATGSGYQNVVESFKKELKHSVVDPNYKVISPVPVGVLNLGGQGKALMLTAEIEQVQAEILAGMNVPREFIFGGMSWSGSSISLKILENQFITYRLLIQDFLQNFLVKGMARERGEWASDADDDKIPNVSMSEIKMQDDVQQKQLIISLNQTGKVPDETVWRVMGFDPDSMRESLKEEAKRRVKLEEELEILKIESQSKIQIAQLKAQMEIQKIQAELEAEFTNSAENRKLQQAQMQQEQAQMQHQVDMQGQAEQQQMAYQQQMAQQEQPGEQQQSGKQQPDKKKENNNTKKPNNNQQGEVDKILEKIPPQDRDQLMAIVNELSKMPPNQQLIQVHELQKQVPPDYMNVIITLLRKAPKQQSQNIANQGISALEAQKIALQLVKMTPEQQYQALEQFVGNDKILVQQQLDALKEQQPAGNQKTTTDMRPMPEQRPPRRK